jgi:hypothetical protein
MRHSADLIFFVESNRITPQIRIYSIFKTALAHESGDPGVLFNKKKQGSKILCDCPFKE